MCMMAVSQRFYIEGKTRKKELDLNPDVGLPRMRHHPGLRLHPMNRSPWSRQGLPASLHPEEAGEGEGEDEDEKEDAKGEHDSRRGEAELWVWTLRDAGCIKYGCKLDEVK